MKRDGISKEFYEGGRGVIHQSEGWEQNWELRLYPLTCLFTGFFRSPDCSNFSNSIQLLPVQPQVYLLVLVSIYLLRPNSLLHLLRLLNLLLLAPFVSVPTFSYMSSLQ
jgi:hypothetical protein